MHIGKRAAIGAGAGLALATLGSLADNSLETFGTNYETLQSERAELNNVLTNISNDGYRQKRGGFGSSVLV